MILGSGLLVLAALVLLLVGLVQPALGLVYGSIGASLAAFVLLLLAVRRRRGEVLPADRGDTRPR